MRRRTKPNLRPGRRHFSTVLNLRGVKESVLLWMPVFFLFVVAVHVRDYLRRWFAHLGELPGIASGLASDVSATTVEVGWLGIDRRGAASLQPRRRHLHGHRGGQQRSSTLREPRVQTGKRTMVYMGASLSFVVGGLLLAYLLYHVAPVAGKTLNAVFCLNKSPPTWPAMARKKFCDRRAGVIGGAAVDRRADGLFRRTARAGQHGGGPLDADALCHVERPAGHAERRPAHGRRGAAWCWFSRAARRQPARRALQHQRLHHLQPLAARHGAALVAGSRNGTEMENKNSHQRLRPDADRWHSHLALRREIRSKAAGPRCLSPAS